MGNEGTSFLGVCFAKLKTNIQRELSLAITGVISERRVGLMELNIVLKVSKIKIEYFALYYSYYFLNILFS